MPEQEEDRLKNAESLRQRAERMVAGREAVDKAVSAERLHELVHELEVHKVELEIQNESLRASQSELEHSRNRYAELYDFAPIGYVTLDAKGTIRELNLTAAAMLGVERGRLLGYPLVTFINRDGKNRFVGHLRRCAQAEECEEFVAEVMLQSKANGSNIAVQLRSAVYDDPDTGERSYRTALLDLSELRQSQQKLRAAEENFAALADNMLQLAWMADETGWIFWYNRRWYEFTGSTPDAVEGVGWQALVHPEHRQRVAEKFRQHLNRGEQWEDTFPIRGRDGTYRWFLSRAMPLQSSGGKLGRWFGTSTDITERLEFEETLKEADRRKDEFLATLAHELRNPLAPLRTGLELLAADPGDPELIREVHQVLENQTGQLVRLVDDLLDMSRISRGVIELQKTRLSLESALESAVQAARPMVDEAGQKIELRLPDQPLFVDADPVRLSQIFSNLIINAIKYSSGRGRVHVDVVPQDEQVEVRVRDEGIGMDPAMLENIFQMFVQGDPHQEQSHGGLGIGLTLCRSLVDLHGGSIRAFSEGVGQGSEFIVTLPLSSSPDASGGQGEHHLPNSSQQSAQRILVVDDNQNAADMIAALLSGRGHQLRVAYSGKGGLAVGDEFQPNLVLLDLGMPDMDGFATAQAIRQRPWGKNAFVAAVTGWGQDKDRQETRETGFDAHLVKPVDAGQLASVLDQASSRDASVSARGSVR